MSKLEKLTKLKKLTKVVVVSFLLWTAGALLLTATYAVMWCIKHV